MAYKEQDNDYSIDELRRMKSKLSPKQQSEISDLANSLQRKGYTTKESAEKALRDYFGRKDKGSSNGFGISPYDGSDPYELRQRSRFTKKPGPKPDWSNSTGSSATWGEPDPKRPSQPTKPQQDDRYNEEGYDYNQDNKTTIWESPARKSKSSNNTYYNKNYDVDGDGRLSRDEIKEMQRMLKDAGYDIGKAGVDGIIGPKTRAAINAAAKNRERQQKENNYDQTQNFDLMKELDYSNDNDQERNYSQITEVNPIEEDYDEEGDLRNYLSPRQLRRIRRNNLDSWADNQDWDNISNEEQEAIYNEYADKRNAIDDQYAEDRAYNRDRRIAARQTYRDEVADIKSRMANGDIDGYDQYWNERGDARARYRDARANIRANGGRIVTRDMMRRKYGEPMIADNGNEYYLL